MIVHVHHWTAKYLSRALVKFRFYGPYLYLQDCSSLQLQSMSRADIVTGYLGITIIMREDENGL